MKIAIIGGGAAGMMCAATINELNPSAELVLLEKNTSLGKKVLISGGGRCNVTTGIEDIKTVLTKYPRGNKFLTSALYNFSPRAVYEWFESHGVPLKCEEDLRVFPESDNGAEIVGVFIKVFNAKNTQVLFKHGATKIDRVAGQFKINCPGHPSVTADSVVLALGGQAFRHTGSTGDGYSLAEGLGHHITPLAASLHSYVTTQKWPRSVAGVSFANATITAVGHKTHSATGPILFTHHGVTGPAVFAVSSLSAYEELSPKTPLKIFVDVLPEMSETELETELKKLCSANPKKSFKNTIHTFVPNSFAEVICTENTIDHEKKNAEISKVQIKSVITWLKKIPLHAVVRGAGDEFVTAGGVDLSEVNPLTMESKICPNLYFGGEILDIDGFTGGFNLQASWATGRLAGESIAKKIS